MGSTWPHSWALPSRSPWWVRLLEKSTGCCCAVKKTECNSCGDKQHMYKHWWRETSEWVILCLGGEMDVFRLQSAELKPRRKQEGWDGGVLGPASCPPLDLSAFDLSPSSCWCFVSAQPWAVGSTAPGGGQGKEIMLLPPYRACDGCATIAGPFLPLRGRPDLMDWSCVGKYTVGAGCRCAVGRCKKQESGTNKIICSSASS